MQISPEIDAFQAEYDAGRAQVVRTRIVADLETPVSAYLKLAGGKPNAFLLESVEGGAVRNRYSFIGVKPDLIWRCDGDRAEINRRALDRLDRFETCPEPTLDSLRAVFAESRIDLPEDLPPMAAGLFGYMGYDTVRLVETLPDANPKALPLPDGVYMRPTVIAVFDTIEDVITIVTPVRPNPAISSGDAYDGALSRIDAAKSALERAVPHDASLRASIEDLPEPVSNMSPNDYVHMVERGKEYVRAGDVFQVVLSQRFETPFTLPPFSLYRALRRTNPSPFLFFLDFGGFGSGDFSIVGSSPEILVRLRDGIVTIRPIAGTRPRGATAVEDKANEESLLNDPKELAEHLMLLDLGRNDVGRVAKIGSVSVTERNIVEYYSHVMHIVSNVEGAVKDGVDAIEALMAGFPAGTVSGAPKVRAMEIIDELEPDRRGVYGGCIGYFGANGAMDTCIALRTAIVHDRRMIIQAGAGVVYDSDPMSEHRECVAKAKALVRAAEEAVRFSIGAN